MASSPLVTVLVTTYNQENYIARALDSILAQKTDFEFEILICEDCGTDGTRDIITRYAARDPRIRLYLREANVGISRNWFEGLAMAKGRFVCTLEGDDWWLSEDKLQRQVDFLRAHPAYSAVSHTLLLTDDSGGTYGTEPHDPRVLGRDATLPLFLRGVTFSCTACLCRNIFGGMGPREKAYVTANRSIADFALCLLLLDAGRVFVLPEALAAYRVAGSDPCHQNYNGSQSAVKKYQEHLEVIRASEKYWQGRYPFTLCYLAGTFFPFCDRLKTGGLGPFVRAMGGMPLRCRLLFPFYFAARCLALLGARLARAAKGARP